MLKPVPKEPREDNRGFQDGGENYDRHHATAFDEDKGPPVEGLQPTLRPVITPSSVGATLSITREKFGQDLQQVAQALRIRLAYLEAIEDDRYGDLPGLTYAVGFVRSYSEYLGLDSKLMVQRYKDEAQGLNRNTQLVFPVPVQEGKVPTGAIVLVALILVATTYLGWTYFSDESQPPGPAVVESTTSEQTANGGPTQGSGTAQVGEQSTGQNTNLAAQPAESASSGTSSNNGAPGQPVSGQPVSGQPLSPQPAAGDTQGDAVQPAPSQEPAATTVPDGTEALAATEPQSVAVAEAAEPSTVTEGVTTDGAELGTGSAMAATPAAEAETTAAASAEANTAPAAPAAPQVSDSSVQPEVGEQLAAVPPPLPAAVEAAHTPRLVIRATQDSWVQIRNARDEAILTEVLREGDSYEVPEEQGLVLLTGNAGGIILVVDGKDMPPLGAVGAVKRNIVLDPDKLLEN